MEEPMDINTLDTDFDNKENTIHHNNVLPRTPCTEKGYEELDVSELNMKLRYSNTPASSPMSRSYNFNCTENKSVKGDNPNIPVIELSHMTRSLNTTVSLNDTLKSTNALPLQALSTDPSGDYNKSVLQLLGPKCIDNVTNTVDTVQDDENLSFPSTSSSLAQTPDATTPTKEISKEDGGSPIMRGLKSVFSMFRPSQSPITSTEAKPQNEIILPDAQTQKLLASTPISSKKYKESTSRKSPHKESITFTDDLEKELQWNDETTIIFSHEKIPIHKLFPEEKLFKLTENNKVVLDDTVEFMDVSYYNDSLGDKTITNNQSIKNLNNSEMVLGDSDSEFVDCETTFTKDHSLLDVKKSIHVNNENTVANELTTNANKSEINEVAVHLDKIDVTLNNENVTNNHETNHDEFINNNANKTQEGNTNKYCVAGQSEVEKIVNKLDLNISNSTIKVPENDDIQMMSTNIIADTNDNKHQVDTKLECTEDNTAKTKVSDETINLDMTMNFNNYTMPIDKNSTIDILTSIENITEKSEECNSINNTKNNSYLTEHIKTENRFEETLPNDIPLPDETDTTEKSRPNSPLIYEFDVTIEANEVKSLDIPTKQCDITDENLNQNDTITEPETNSVVVSEVHDVITTYLPERNKEQNETHDLSINHSNVSEEEITICSDMQNDIIVAEKEVECQNQEMPKVNILQETEIFKLDQDKLSNPCENVSNIQTNILETTIVLNDLSNDERPHQNVIDENQTEVQTINFVSENMNAANEVIDNEEEVIISENNSPYVSLSAAIYEPNCQLKLKEHTSTVETPCNLELKVAEIPPSSPKIISRGNYNFNFDEMDDPFNSKTKIRSSMSPEKVNLSMNVAETVNKSQEIEVKVLDKDKRKSQHLKRKSGNHNITNTELNSSKIDNCYKKLNEISEMGKQEQQFNISVDNFNNNEKISELSKPDIMQENAPPVIDNVISLEVVEEHNDIITEANTSSETKVSLSENQNTDYVAPLASTEYVLSKNVFNIPEIGDSGFNPFATISKMQHSPDKSTNITVETESKEVADESHEELNCSSSSKFADGKNVTVREIDTEDEDTIEGPFLDTDELNNIDKMSDFDSEKVDMIQFSNVNQNGMEENDEGEMFIDAEAFEFLLNQNKAMVADSGKESLFLKFDPLFAKRMSSIQMQGKQSILQKPVKQSSSESTVMDISSIPGPSNVMDMSYEITNDVTYEDKCDETIINTITKPTMAVTPAVNSAVSPRNKTITPTRPNRRSFTFTSPAIAVIDRLLSMSANNSILAQDTSLVHVSNEQHEAELALTQLRELLAEKEISVHQLKCESNELKYRLETLESQMKRLEEESQQRLQHINSLNEKLAEKTRDNKNMAVVVEEYERTIASLIAEKEEEKRLREEERMKLIRERDEQTAHLANMECSFNDLHSKYEKSKGIILSYKANEDVYRKNIQDFENNFAKVQNNYDLLKQHATSKLNHANQELEKINRAHEADILKLHTMLKRKEVEITSLEESLAQKTKANDELAAICDELINKVG